MKTGTFDQDLKNEIDEKQRLIDHLCREYPWNRTSSWLKRLYAEKWALVDQIGRT